MVKIAICEDEVIHQEILNKYIQKILIKNSIQYEILIFNSGEELLKNYPQNVDIFLLDIQMDKIDGMQVAKKIRKIDEEDVEIIFITSLIEYIQQGYEVGAYRYLLKPIKYEELENHLIPCINSIIDNKNNYLVIDVKQNIYKIKINKIVYIEIQKKDMIIHTTSQNYELRMTMEKIQKELNTQNFYRCHKSFLININYIKIIKQNIAILENDIEVPISRYKFKELKNKFLDYLGEVLC